MVLLSRQAASRPPKLPFAAASHSDSDKVLGLLVSDAKGTLLRPGQAVCLPLPSSRVRASAGWSGRGNSITYPRADPSRQRRHLHELTAPSDPTTYDEETT